MGWGELPSGLGVNVFGYFYAESGTAGRFPQLLETFRKSEPFFMAVPHTRTPNRQEHPFEDAATQPPSSPVNIVGDEADEPPGLDPVCLRWATPEKNPTSHVQRVFAKDSPHDEHLSIEQILARLENGPNLGSPPRLENPRLSSRRGTVRLLGNRHIHRPQMGLAGMLGRDLARHLRNPAVRINKFERPRWTCESDLQIVKKSSNP